MENAHNLYEIISKFKDPQAIDKANGILSEMNEIFFRIKIEKNFFRKFFLIIKFSLLEGELEKIAAGINSF